MKLEQELENAKQEAIEKALKSLAVYKFERFGYWADNWVRFNQLSAKVGQKDPNPFRDFVQLAKEVIVTYYGDKTATDRRSSSRRTTTATSKTRRPLDYRWQEGITHLKRFIEREGHALVNINHKEEGHALGRWVAHRRTAYKKGTLSQDRIDELNSLGFRWEARMTWNMTWKQGFTLLRRFVEREGHALVNINHKEEGYALGRWVSGRRIQRTKGTLSQPRIDALSNIGFIWYPKRVGGMSRNRRSVIDEDESFFLSVD